jgi:hypothetical protein
MKSAAAPISRHGTDFPESGRGTDFRGTDLPDFPR